MTAEVPTNVPAQYDALEERSCSLLYENNGGGHKASSFAAARVWVDSMDTQVQHHHNILASRKRNGEGDLHDDGKQVKHYRLLQNPCQESTTGTSKSETLENYQDLDEVRSSYMFTYYRLERSIL